MTIAVGTGLLVIRDNDAHVASPSLTTVPLVRPLPTSPTDTANRLIAFAWNPTRAHFDRIPFAGETVQLALGKEVVVTVPVDELAKPANWWVDVEHFAGRVGPFSALDALSWQILSPTVGEHKQCSAPPTPAPPGLGDRTQVGIQPDGVDSCINWFAVDLYLDHTSRILAVRLDRFEP